jgi:hypothetical protein
MAQVTTQVPSFRPLYTAPVSERQNEEGACGPTILAPRTTIPPDLESAYGIITGIVFGLLAWIGLLLPALYFLL